jgi:dephospho-CoA kinase
MLKIGLTGNYYSGQNDVEKIFSKLDVKVFDADLLLKYLLFFSKKHKDEIKSTYGKNIYNLGLLDLSKFNTTKKNSIN